MWFAQEAYDKYHAENIINGLILHPSTQNTNFIWITWI